MTYWEAIDADVTKAEAKREIERHSASWEEFVAEYGDHDIYPGEQVLAFLGY